MAHNPGMGSPFTDSSAYGMDRMTRRVDEDEIERDEQEWEAETVVCACFGDDDVSDVKGDVLFGEAAWG